MTHRRPAEPTLADVYAELRGILQRLARLIARWRKHEATP